MSKRKASCLDQLPVELLLLFIVPYLNVADLRRLYNTRNTAIRSFFHQRPCPKQRTIQCDCPNIPLGQHIPTRYTLHQLIESTVAVDAKLHRIRYGVTDLCFADRFNHPMSAGMIPPSVTKITFGFYFDKPLSAGVLPPSLTQIAFGFYFNQPLSAGVFPQSVGVITFGCYFDQLLSVGVLPPNLTQVTFGYAFNQPLSAGMLPASLTHITFGSSFNQPLSAGVLPASITNVVFGDHFNRPLSPGVFPPSVVNVTFGSKFKQTLIAGLFPAHATVKRSSFFLVCLISNLNKQKNEPVPKLWGFIFFFLFFLIEFGTN